MSQKTLLFYLSFAFSFAFEASAVAATCSQSKMAELKEYLPINPYTLKVEQKTVYLDCDPILTASDTIYKRIIIEGVSGSNVNLNCNGAKLLNFANWDTFLWVQSRKYFSGGGTRYEKVSNVVVKNCNITGTIGIRGYNGVAKTDSKSASFVQTVQSHSPSNVTFDNINLYNSSSRVSFYVMRGVSGVSLKNSNLEGQSSAPAIYLGAESTNTTIEGNAIYLQGNQNDREQLAIDASDYNTIKGNTFKGLHRGGVYLYRNCGEDGIIRHTTPSHNQITNNTFYYLNYTGDNLGVHIGSRNGQQNYCSADNGSSLGSSGSNLDHATFNSVSNNKVYNRNPNSIAKVTNSAINHSNAISGNTRVNGTL